MKSVQKIIWRLLGLIDKQLDKLTSYRLVLYALLADLGVGVLLASGGRLPFKWYELSLSAVWLLGVCWIFNRTLARFLNIPSNKESDLITALILSLIMTPVASMHGYLALAFASGAAIASKFLLTYGQRHIFNPAAFGAVVSGLVISEYASWWVGTAGMLPVVLLGGLLILRKMKRIPMAAVFYTTVILVIMLTFHGDTGDNFRYILIHSQIAFFVGIMLIEPLTSPTKLRNYGVMAALVGICYTWNKLHLSPEEALLIGNAVGFLLEPNLRTKLIFVGMRREAADIYSFLFRPTKKIKYSAGQYIELTLPQASSDSRGNRRYMTIASSPTEDLVQFAIRVPENPSAFKRQLTKFKESNYLLASQLAGSFTLPKDNNRKLVLIAGGVGITPFRSMAKQLTDQNLFRSINIIYLAKNDSEFTFKNIFSDAEASGIKTDYIATGDNGRLSSKKLSQLVPDFKDRTFYISGPYGMVSAVRDTILELGVNTHQIKQDYFPGYG